MYGYDPKSREERAEGIIDKLESALQEQRNKTPSTETEMSAMRSTLSILKRILSLKGSLERHMSVIELCDGKCNCNFEREANGRNMTLIERLDMHRDEIIAQIGDSIPDYVSRLRNSNSTIRKLRDALHSVTRRAECHDTEMRLCAMRARK